MRSRIIIIEDEPVIALDIEQAVVEADCFVAGMAHTLKEALAMLESVPCDGVILDANLAGKTAEPIVERLRAGEIPFVVVSGYTREQLDFVDDSIPIVGKPFATDSLISSIREHLLGETA